MKVYYSAQLIGVARIELDVFEDRRGRFIETYNQSEYRRAGIEVEFKQDDLSYSIKDVVRGIHGDPINWKLLSCALGEIELRVYDCHKGLRYFGCCERFHLRPGRQVLVPPGYGNAYWAKTDSIFTYKQSSNYDRSIQFTYRYDDPRFDQPKWNVTNPILSERDDKGPFEP